MKNSVVLENLTVRKRKRLLVNNVSLQVAAGEIVGLLGPNGAGKTTTFESIIGLYHGDHGRVLINGTDVTNTSESKRARLGLGYLPQEPSIHRGLTVTENILAALQMRNDLDHTQRTQELDRLITEFNLDSLRNTKGMSLSGGERRRTEIARALAANPTCILLDEPFAGVDPISVDEIKKMIIDLKRRNLAILITDHNVRETLDICERGYILNNGEIIAAGSPTQLLANEKVREVYLGQDFEMIT
ncbi:MAG: LPS export ABC transporter ATP-binding protein [Pseudomonadota bacterium]|nr:LPS export ABC transporter ATP-binding protein [Pseudomonadota bacterium]